MAFDSIRSPPETMHAADQKAVAMHPLRIIVDHHVILISELLGTVCGDSNRKR